MSKKKKSIAALCGAKSHHANSSITKSTPVKGCFKIIADNQPKLLILKTVISADATLSAEQIIEITIMIVMVIVCCSI